MLNLIYYTVGIQKKDVNSNYIDLLYMNIDSLGRTLIDVDNTHILIITDEKTKKEITNVIKSPFKIDFHIVTFEILEECIINKLKIYQYEKINQYDKILYCDVDILWNSSPDVIFDCVKEDKIYISLEGGSKLMNNSLFGGKLITDEECKDIKSNIIQGMNTGFFVFKSKMSYVFENIYKYMKDNIDKINVVVEQPYMNVYLYRNKCYSIETTKYINHQSILDNPFNLHIRRVDTPLIHFACCPGDFLTKHQIMSVYYIENIVQRRGV